MAEEFDYFFVTLSNNSGRKLSLQPPVADLPWRHYAGADMYSSYSISEKATRQLKFSRPGDSPYEGTGLPKITLNFEQEAIWDYNVVLTFWPVTRTSRTEISTHPVGKLQNTIRKTANIQVIDDVRASTCNVGTLEVVTNWEGCPDDGRFKCSVNFNRTRWTDE